MPVRTINYEKYAGSLKKELSFIRQSKQKEMEHEGTLGRFDRTCPPSITAREHPPPSAPPKK